MKSTTVLFMGLLALVAAFSPASAGPADGGDLIVQGGGAADFNLGNIQPGQTSEERAQANHEAQVDRRLDRIENIEGDTGRLREEQQYRRTHKN